MRQDDHISCKSFHGLSGHNEHFIAIRASGVLDFRQQVAFVQDRYRHAIAQLGLAPQTAIFRRLFLSDVLNQADFIRQTDLLDDLVAVSIVQQPPLHGSKIALLAYHIETPTPLTKQRLSPRHLLVKQEGQRHLWSTRLCSCDHETRNSSEQQTIEIFNDLIETLEQNKGNLRDHCIRTWIYMKDVDVFYKGMVDARRELFTRHGLTADTHYIASTGIEGACAHRHDIVAMDAYSNLDLHPDQTSYLNDFEQLCPTKDYNVTFERGTRIAYADRAQLFISGTASIDKTGEVVHLGDVLSQLDRAIENTESLLRDGQASLDDLMYLFVYLRDPADFDRINHALRARFPDLPILIVQGSVCRPAWLVEIEGIAIIPHHNPALPIF